MRIFIGFILCLFLASCGPTPKPGETYRHGSTGQVVKVESVGRLSEITQYISDDQFKLTYPGRTPNFETQMPAGTPDSSDLCVLYKVVTPAPDPSLPPKIDYFIYKEGNFTKAFSKEE